MSDILEKGWVWDTFSRVEYNVHDDDQGGDGCMSQ